MRLLPKWVLVQELARIDIVESEIYNRSLGLAIRA